MKELLAFSIVLLMGGAFIVLDIKVLIYISICAIFFPVIISFMGHDAINTGTITIFFLYARYSYNALFEKKFIKEKYDYWIYLLIIFSAISIIFNHYNGTLVADQTGRAIRHFFGFVGAMLIFTTIKNFPLNKKFTLEFYNYYIEKLLSFILIMVAVHVLIAMFVKFIPSSGTAFQLFLSRDLDTLEIAGRGEIERIKTFVFDFEGFGEVLAILAPITLHKIFQFKTKFWFVCFLLFTFGVLLTATRSGISLFIFGSLLCLLYYSKHKIGKVMAFTTCLSLILILISIYYPALFADILKRYNETKDIYNAGGSITEIINRSRFTEAWNITLSTLTVFGHSVTIEEFHFHNLFLTVLYQKGILGSILFLAILVYPLIQLIKAFRIDKSFQTDLVFACLLSFILFFINETKYEFIRHASYQQICWALFGIYYLVSKQALKRNDTVN